MVTIMLVSEKRKTNEMLASSIIGVLDKSVNIISSIDTDEAEQIIGSEEYDIDLFIFQVKMKPKSGTMLETFLRRQKRYKDKPVLLLTNLSYNMVGYPQLAGYESYKRKNYISMPLERLDVQAKLCLYLDEILKEQNVQRKKAIYIKHNQGEIIIDRSDILYAEVQNKLLTIHSTFGRFELKRITLQEFCELVGSETFMQAHKSFALNTEAITELVCNGRRNWLATFADGSACPVSLTYYEKIKKKYMQTMTK